MTIKLDVLNFPYDSAEPAFTELASGYYHHRVNKRLYEKGAFDAKLVAEGKAFEAGEVGDQSAGYKATHLSIVSGGTATAPAKAPAKAPATAPATAPAKAPAAVVTLAAITASVTKVPSATADDTGTVTVAGGPADKAYTVTFTVKEATSGGDDVQNVAIAKGDTAAQAAAKVAAASSDPNAVVTASGAVVTVKPSSGSTIAKLSVLVT